MLFARRPKKEVLSSLADVIYWPFWPHASRMDFPPTPLRSAVIQMTRRSLDQADHHQGNRNLWLRTMDRLGLGFVPEPDPVSHQATAGGEAVMLGFYR